MPYQPKKNRKAYTKQCINVYVIHAHVHIYPLQYFFVGSSQFLSLVRCSGNRCKIKQYKSLMMETRGKNAHALTHIFTRTFIHYVKEETKQKKSTCRVFIRIFILVYGIEKLLKFSGFKQNMFNKIGEASIFEILSV